MQEAVAVAGDEDCISWRATEARFGIANFRG